MLLDMQRARRCGAKTRNAWKHGSYSVAAKAERVLVKRLLKNVSSLRKSLSKGER
jgi:hypothetical protein